MTINEFHMLRNDRRYVLKCYHGKRYHGILVENHNDGGNTLTKYIVENPNIRAFNNPQKSIEDKIEEGIMIQINIETISHWPEQKDRR